MPKIRAKYQPDPIVVRVQNRESDTIRLSTDSLNWENEAELALKELKYLVVHPQLFLDLLRSNIQYSVKLDRMLDKLEEVDKTLNSIRKE